MKNKLNNNSETRCFSEALGQTIAFGRSFSMATPLRTIKHHGFHFDAEVVVRCNFSMDDTVGIHRNYTDLMGIASQQASRKNEDPSTWGVIMSRVFKGDLRDEIEMYIVRLFPSRKDALNAAEEVMWMMEVYGFSPNEEDEVVRLVDEGYEILTESSLEENGSHINTELLGWE
tara:strand:+ start:200 stop:718 length:519 start_codon:yes stop_codon:yes gene_type:complete